jgi:hypothetical protein
MIEAGIWVWEGEDDGDIVSGRVEVERTDENEVSITSNPREGPQQTIYLSVFAAGQVAEALAWCSNPDEDK